MMGKIFICRFCGFEWEARVLKPKACCRCKRYDYDKPPNAKKGAEKVTAAIRKAVKL